MLLGPWAQRFSFLIAGRCQMAKSLLTCQTLGGVPMERSRDNHESSSMKVGHPIFAALYDPVGASAERRWMGGAEVDGRAQEAVARRGPWRCARDRWRHRR